MPRIRSKAANELKKGKDADDVTRMRAEAEAVQRGAAECRGGWLAEDLEARLEGRGA